MKTKRKNKDIKSGKILNLTSSISGTMGFLGSYQICHSICLAIVSILSLIGIAVVGMPLLFLQKVAVPFWIAAVVLLVITLIFYLRKKCIPKNLLILNAGIIIAGIPFQSVQDYILYFWIIGGIFIVLSIFFYLKPKIFKHK